MSEPLPTMAKRDYFLAALRAGSYRYKAWIFECFSQVIRHNHPLAHTYPYALTRHEDGHYTFLQPGDVTPTVLTDVHPDHGPFRLMDELILGPGDLPNVKEAIVTCYGNALVNAVALIYAFGDKVDFMAGPLTVKGMEKKIEPRLIANDATPQGARNLTIAEYKKFNDGINHLTGLTQLCIPGATVKSMTIDPAILKRRDELLKEYKDRLDDPVIQAHITAELVKMDRESMKGDPAERLYIKAKSYDIVRKRMHIFVGEESGFGKKGSFIKTSLSEGWNIEELPSMANSMRAGSFNRGSRTALGGVEAKNNYRIFQNTVVAEDDCGTKLGLRITLDPAMAKYWIGNYVINKDGSLTELTAENLKAYTGVPIIVRSPAYCKTAKQNLCAHCVGSKIAQTPTAISTYCSDTGSIFLSSFLAAAHGSALKTHVFNYLSMID